MRKKKIFFEDNGQTLLQMTVDQYGTITECFPCPSWHWEKYQVVNFEKLKIGGNVELKNFTLRSIQILKFKIEKLEDLN